VACGRSDFELVAIPKRWIGILAGLGFRVALAEAAMLRAQGLLEGYALLGASVVVEWR